jgi:hypothetical protein
LDPGLSFGVGRVETLVDVLSSEHGARVVIFPDFLRVATWLISPGIPRLSLLLLHVSKSFRVTVFGSGINIKISDEEESSAGILEADMPDVVLE